MCTTFLPPKHIYTALNWLYLPVLLLLRGCRPVCLPGFLPAGLAGLSSTKVLTYPSWCVIRGQGEVPEATRAMRGRILESFTDALDGKGARTA